MNTEGFCESVSDKEASEAVSKIADIYYSKGMTVEAAIAALHASVIETNIRLNEIAHILQGIKK